MADPCVDTTATIALSTAGTPAVLSADVRNPASTFSGTLGDDTTHAVTDTGVPHTLDQSFTVPNAGSKSASGIVVVALNPIYLHATGDDITIVGFARLTVDSVVVDERDLPASGLDVPEGASQLLSWGALVGQIDIASADSTDFQVLLSITQTGASTGWSFRYGGSKAVVTLGY